MRIRKIAFVTAMVGLSLAATGAQAVTMTRSYTATGIFPPGQPLSSVQVNFELTFDPMVSVASLTPNSYSSNGNMAFNVPVAFSLQYDPAGSLAYIGGVLNGPGLVITQTNDFYVQFRLDGGGNVIPNDVNIAYALSNRPGSYASTTALIVADPAAPAAPGAVPEPATWALMLVGFGGVGYTMRRSRKVAVSFS